MQHLVYFTKNINGTNHFIPTPFKALNLMDGSSNSANSSSLNLRLDTSGDQGVELGDKIFIWDSTSTQLNLTSVTTLANLYNITAITLSTVSPKNLPIITCAKPVAIPSAGTYTAAAIGPALLIKPAYSDVFTHLMTQGYTLQYKNKADESYVVPGNSITSRYVMDTDLFIMKLSHDELKDITLSEHRAVVKLREVLRSGPQIYLTHPNFVALINALINIDSPTRTPSATESGHILNQLWTHPIYAINRAEYLLQM